MSQATVLPFSDPLAHLDEAAMKVTYTPDKDEDEAFTLAIRRFIAAMQAKKAADQDAKKALDVVIAKALTSAVVHANCGALKRIIWALEDQGYGEKSIKRLGTQIVEYAYDELVLPERSIAFVAGNKQFGCRSKSFKVFLEELKKEDSLTWEAYLDTCKTFSAWQEGRAKAKKAKTKTGIEKIRSNFSAALRIFDNDLLESEDDTLEAIRKLIKAYMGEIN